jgi:G3E family GTPase
MATAAVLINEFGSVAVDHHLVTKIDEDVIMLDSAAASAARYAAT